MVYMGSKSKYASDIVGIINSYIAKNNIEKFYDIMCGGANICDKITCKEVYANDLSPTLIALHKQAQEDFSKIPENGSREYWDKAYGEFKKILKDFSSEKNLEIFQSKVSMPLYEIGAIEWYGSWGTRGFPGGYANEKDGHNYFQQRRKNHQAQAQAENYKKICFTQGRYQDLDIPENAVIYSDSPYHRAKPYQINPKFDFDEYYEWLREKSKTNPIFISEQQMPDDFEIVWTKGARRTIALHNDFKATEHLYFIDNRKGW